MFLDTHEGAIYADHVRVDFEEIGTDDLASLEEMLYQALFVTSAWDSSQWWKPGDR